MWSVARTQYILGLFAELAVGTSEPGMSIPPAPFSWFGVVFDRTLRNVAGVLAVPVSEQKLPAPSLSPGANVEQSAAQAEQFLASC